MRALLPIAVVSLLGFALSGCVAYDVASAGVSVATTVVTTTAHVAKGAVETVTPGGDDDEDSDSDSDHKKKHKSSDDDDDN